MALFKRNTVAIRLLDISFLSKGLASVKDVTSHSVTSTLVWPRTGFQSRTYVSTIKIEGSEKKYGMDEWSSSILLKETIQAPSALKIALSRGVSSEELSIFLRKLAKAAFGSIADAADKAIGGGILGDIVASPFDTLAATSQDWQPETLCEGELFLDNDILENGGIKELKLYAPSDIFRVIATGNKGGTPRKRRVLSKGDEIATINLEFFKVAT